MKLKRTLKGLHSQKKELGNPDKIDPTSHEDIFENPKSFDEAWNCPDPWQCAKWREGTNKERNEMEQHEAWAKMKKRDTPKGRTLVKCKWAFGIKRNGVFMARLAVCGHSQAPGIDFNWTGAQGCNGIIWNGYRPVG